MCSVELIIILEIFAMWSNEWTSLVHRHKSNPIDPTVTGKLLAKSPCLFHTKCRLQGPWISIIRELYVSLSMISLRSSENRYSR